MGTAAPVGKYCSTVTTSRTGYREYKSNEKQCLLVTAIQNIKKIALVLAKKTFGAVLDNAK